MQNNRIFLALPGRRLSIFFIFFFSLLALLFWDKGIGRCQGWSDIIIRLLPDDSFAVIKKDNQGIKIRHCPHHDTNGKLDEEQLIYLLGTINRETWIDPANKAIARKHMEKHYNKFIKRVIKKGLEKPVIINSASLTELVTLPQIGPVLAVRIVEYRNTHSSYQAIKDIKKVEGIGQGIFDAIRYYIKTD
jgi:competence ComEA-like helix-hairpin-helix protein